METKQFQAAFSIDPTDADMIYALDNESPELLQRWLDRVLKKELDDLSMRELRSKASQYKIPFYTSFGKADLILKILEIQRARQVQELTEGMPPDNGRHDVSSASGFEHGVPLSEGSGGSPVVHIGDLAGGCG